MLRSVSDRDCTKGTSILGARHRPGVDPAVADEVFERFSQAEGATEGFGLGLSIVSAIAEAHGGTIVLDDSVADEAAHGATFRLQLPLGGTA
ncbi:sensor histidine kinase [Aeromicrobium sp. UC242_57]|uniref:sensor histidine kinase n=1 Tax=Aeromicrobium sp. UC242_57 TaxID=3374624 RepID=UPI003797BEC0